ncbi:MAG: alpha/beta hydrolase [Bacteroidia bacterium]|nr:alpha/beta hydrolase [Bacteroidia bacterium]MDW8157310.1 alpha/beta hydrolase [Bacteroidia bacterium]
MLINRLEVQQGAGNRLFSYNIILQENGFPKPIVIFLHGFKGFKDWGCFPLAAQTLANRGLITIPMNFSHNGTTLEAPTELADLDAFGNNNFSKELEDIQKLLTALPAKLPEKEVDWNRVYIIGHSRGGGIAIIAAAENEIIRKVVTWAGVARLGFASLKPEEIEEWKTKGVRYVLNARTHQEMPLYYQLYEDYIQNQKRFNIEEKIKNLHKPILIIHGTADESVPFGSANLLHSWQPAAQLLLIEGANHTFGGCHPFNSNQLPDHFEKVIQATVQFLLN